MNLRAHFLGQMIAGSYAAKDPNMKFSDLIFDANQMLILFQDSCEHDWVYRTEKTMLCLKCELRKEALESGSWGTMDCKVKGGANDN